MSLISDSANEKVRRFVLEKFPLAKKRGIKDSDELLESGIVDSLGVLDLVAFLEHEFGLSVSDDDLMPENFGSIESIGAFAKVRQIGNAQEKA